MYTNNANTSAFLTMKLYQTHQWQKNDNAPFDVLCFLSAFHCTIVALDELFVIFKWDALYGNGRIPLFKLIFWNSCNSANIYPVFVPLCFIVSK